MTTRTFANYAIIILEYVKRYKMYFCKIYLTSFFFRAVFEKTRFKHYNSAVTFVAYKYHTRRDL